LLLCATVSDSICCDVGEGIIAAVVGVEAAIVAAYVIIYKAPIARSPMDIIVASILIAVEEVLANMING
jgi:hypothetical protein